MKSFFLLLSALSTLGASAVYAASPHGALLSCRGTGFSETGLLSGFLASDGKIKTPIKAAIGSRAPKAYTDVKQPKHTANDRELTVIVRGGKRVGSRIEEIATKVVELVYKGKGSEENRLMILIPETGLKSESRGADVDCTVAQQH